MTTVYKFTKKQVNESVKNEDANYFNVLRSNLDGYANALYSSLIKSNNAYNVDKQSVHNVISLFSKNAQSINLYNNTYIDLFKEIVNENIDSRIKMLTDKSNQLEKIIKSGKGDFNYMIAKTKADHLSEAMDELKVVVNDDINSIRL